MFIITCFKWINSPIPESELGVVGECQYLGSTELQMLIWGWVAAFTIPKPENLKLFSTL